MTYKIKASDVWDTRAKFKAQAKCAGSSVTGEACSWEPSHRFDDRDTRQRAKEHVKAHPGHEVVVTVEDRTVYYVPDSVLEKLKEQE